MGKPLLTDEIIEKANRNASFAQSFSADTKERRGIDKDEFFYRSSLSSDHLEETMEVAPFSPVHKSRRSERERRGMFRARLNKILVVMICLLILLIVAIIWL